MTNRTHLTISRTLSDIYRKMSGLLPTDSRRRSVEQFALRLAYVNLQKRLGTTTFSRSHLKTPQLMRMVAKELSDRKIVGAFYRCGNGEEEARLRSVLLSLDDGLYTCDVVGSRAMKDIGPHKTVERAQAFLQIQWGYPLTYSAQEI